MLFWFAWLMSHFWLNGAAAESTTLERIGDCHTGCSQGLKCKTTSRYWFPPECRDLPEVLNNGSLFQDVSISTVMKCEQKQKCVLFLKIKATLQLNGSIHGVSICTSSAGMITNCKNIHFKRPSRSQMSGQLVTVENDCTEVSPNQQMQISVGTLPNYCSMTWAGTYKASGCNNEDLRENVPECITGRLSYDVNVEKKELKINVSDMLEDYDYHLRLCLKDFICAGTGSGALLKKEEQTKSAVLSFSQPLPCLCIEGWSAVMDAPRVQVCPFKNYLEELWSDISFDPMKEALLWTPACSVPAVVGLCERREGDLCADLPRSSQNASREKMTFATVDPRPRLCIKFTLGAQSWIRCPFAEGFKVWDLVEMKKMEREGLRLISQTKANFSVAWCGKSEESSACHTQTVNVENHKAIDLQLAGESCNSCLHVKRLDVEFAVTVVHCFAICSQSSWDLTRVVLPAAACLAGIIIITLALHILLNVHQRRKQVSDKQKGPALDFGVSASHAQPVFEPQCVSYEKANLISC